jgi:NAD(P)-dependent dehydrogenase (short-subunit alcohol dehydrogenase family)
MSAAVLSRFTALVIGGSGAIGGAIARAYAAAGARVGIAGRDRARLIAAAAEIGAKDYFAADVTRADTLDTLVEEVLRAFGRLDILVNCQGITILKPAEDFTEEEYAQVMATNMTSVFFSCTRFGRHMLERKSGAIVNIASLAGVRGFPRAAAYAVSKHGVIGLTKTLAAEWADRGVRVNAIAPGFFMTALNREKMSSERKQRALARTPMGRFGEVEELAGAAVFLAAPGQRFVTGAVLNVDGGYLAAGI